MKLIITIQAIFLISFQFAIAQTDFQSIRSQRDIYLYGYSSGQNLRDADNLAIIDLISQITVKVESEFTHIMTEKDNNVTEFAKGILRTFSSATLDNAERMVKYNDDGSVEVLRYIKRTDVSRIFADRLRKIQEYASDGYKAEQELRLADALKYYYWAFVLLRTHPDLNRIEANLDGSGNRLLITSLPDRINRILTGIAIDVQSNEYSESIRERRVFARALYSDKLVQNLELRYFTGNDWEGVALRNGVFGMNWYGNHATELKQVRLGLEYRFDNQLILDAEVKDVFDKTNLPSLPNTSLMIELKGAKQSTPPKQLVSDDRMVNRAIKAVIGAIESGNTAELESISTPRGLSNFRAIIAMGKAQPLAPNIEVSHIKLANSTIIRSIPMQFRFQRNRLQFSEMVNIVLNQQGLIDGFTFSIGQRAITDILANSKEWGTEQEKYHLIHFMELYKTAYCTKDLEFVESIFADNALIIVGNVLKQDKNIDDMYGSLGDKVTYLKFSKKDYIERLGRVFRSNEFVNIQFDENTTRRATNKLDDKVFGIQIKQSYYSTNYSDKGYLFLMIDLNDTLKPLIYVRTWQPEKNPDGSIYGVSDFRL
jgi:hypothetical protein